MSGLDGKRPEEDETSGHNNDSYPSSTKRLCPLVIKQWVRTFLQSRMSAIEDQEITSYGNHSKVSH
jgi:hypothetical protein